MFPEKPTPTKVLFPKVTPLRLFAVGEVTLSKDEPLSVDLTMVPNVPTTTKTLGAVVSVVVVVVPEELELLLDSSFLEHEIMVRLKTDIRIVYKILFIFFLHQ
jgi:hypothetical protein